MSGNRLLLDTNIVIYFLNGDQTLATFLEGKTAYISFISKLELLGYVGLTNDQETQIATFLADCVVIHINTDIEYEVIRLRKQYKLKLPDSIIIASAIYHDIPLISADKEFEKVQELNFISYSGS